MSEQFMNHAKLHDQFRISGYSVKITPQYSQTEMHLTCGTRVMRDGIKDKTAIPGTSVDVLEGYESGTFFYVPDTMQLMNAQSSQITHLNGNGSANIRRSLYAKTIPEKS